MHRRDFARVSAAALVAGALPRVSGRPAPQDDRIVVDGLDTSIVNEGFLDLLATGGVDCVHRSLDNTATYAVMYAFLHAQRHRAVPALSVKEIREAKRQGKRSFVFGVQHGNLLEALIPKSPFGTYDILAAGLKGYYDLGLRIHGICYNVANIFGGGCLDPGVPLTRAGRWLVESIHKHRILLDVGGHTGERTSLDALAMSSGVPVVCTHTNVAALNPNPRATTDRVFVAIAATGGVVGVTAISDFHTRSGKTYQAHGPVSPQATLDMHLDHYDYLRKLIGAEHIGLGPDFVWGWGETFNSQPSKSVTFPAEALSEGPAVTVRDFENISKLPNLIAGLKGRGWSPSDLDKLLGGNWMRVYEKAWGS
jgi:membrane dipeptidase